MAGQTHEFRDSPGLEAGGATAPRLRPDPQGGEPNEIASGLETQ